MRVLVVDDEMVARMMLVATVSQLGHECFSADSGEQGWSDYLRLAPDVVISDRVMPGMDGLELCRRIRARNGARYTYIVLVTVRGGAAEALRGVEAGADDYLLKPVEAVDLQVRLTAATRVTELHRSLLDTADELRQANARLAHSEERFRQLVEASPLAIVEFDPEGRVTLCNDAARATFGSLEGGAQCPVALSEDLALRQLVKQLVTGQRFSAYEVKITRRDGKLVDLVVAGAPLCDTNGAATGSIMLAADVSDLKSLEKQLLQTQKLEVVGRLAGGIAHDFNNLLTVVLCRSELILEADGPSFDYRAGVEAIREAAERGVALTSRLLTFSRRRASENNLVCLDEVVASVPELIGGSLGSNISVEISTDAGTACISVGRTQLDHVILNLAVNARDSMPNGGRLIIASSRETVAPGALASDPPGLAPGDYAVVSITDTGLGMDAETSAQCFEPFFTTKPAGKGTGLGLSIVYGIVSDLGGQIRVQTGIGTGTTFTIFLPVVPAPVPSGGVGVAGQRGHHRPLRDPGDHVILLVDDDEDVLVLTRQILEREGYLVLAARNGTEGVATAESYRGVIDLLLTDIVMPELGGIDLARQVVPSRPEMRVVYMSGYTDRSLPQLRLGEKPWFLEKPFQFNVLLETVRVALAEPLIEKCLLA